MKRLALISLFVVCAVSFVRGVARAQVLLNPQTFLTECQTEASATSSVVRTGKKTIMWCALIDREGKLLMINNTDKGGTPQNPMGSDAWRGSIEIAIAKAYTALAFSSNDKALDSRTIGLLARFDFPPSPGTPGTDGGAASLFGIGDTNPFRPPFGFGLGTDDFLGGFHHGIVTFAGGQPIYTKGTSGACGGGKLIGGFGVSGDGVDEDDTVAKGTVLGAGLCLTP
jgi:uncharacterized protein GlcG (DUF336 family)